MLLSKVSPERGDLILPFLAIALKKNNLNDIYEICNNQSVKGIEGYCYLMSAYKILNINNPDSTEVLKSLELIKKAIEEGILEEPVYGWWLFDYLRLNVSEIEINTYNAYPGIPISPDIIYYISSKEALNLLSIVKQFR